jgi:3,4-dihydroxy 2-butanone 4-phosphate synthase / GTP cyclohydrolase II
MKFNSIEEAIVEIKKGKMLVVVDDEDRENEGDLVMAADKVTSASINFMAMNGRGLICLPMPAKRLSELHILPMVMNNTSHMETAFTVSIDAKRGVTTGISAQDRAQTIKVVLDPKSKPEDLARPGHIFPLKAQEGGVLIRAGHTEAAVDLSKLAGLYPAGVICEILNEDGTMARVPQLFAFAKRYNLGIITIKDLIAYRRKTEKLVSRAVTVRFPTRYGEFKLIGFQTTVDDQYHLAVVKGDVAGKQNVLVRVHSECLTGDVFHSLRCDCGEQLAAALEMIEREKLGVLLYMRQEGRGIGLQNKLRAYVLQEEGLDTVEANERLGFKPDLRDYGIGAQILVDLGLTTIRLITNNPRKIIGLEGYGIKVVERIPLEVGRNEMNKRYLKSKKEKLGHLIS